MFIKKNYFKTLCNIEMVLNSFEILLYNLICFANFHRNLSHKTYYVRGFSLILFSCFSIGCRTPTTT